MPEGAVQLNHSLEGVEPQSDGVSKLLFKDQEPVHAKMLIGADGYFSPTRQAVMHDEPPDFAVSARALPVIKSAGGALPASCDGGHASFRH